MTAAKLVATGASRFTGMIRSGLGRLDVLALFPLLTLTALWLDLGDIVLVSAFGLPLLLALQAMGNHTDGASLAYATLRDLKTGQGVVPGQDAMLAMLERVTVSPQHDTACILIQADDWDDIVNRWGYETSEDLAKRTMERLRTTLRHGDLVARLGDARFGVVLQQMPAARLGVREAIVGRLRAAIGEALAVDGGSARLSFCVGHASLIREAADTAAATLTAAEAALAEAHRNGPNAMRAYAPGLLRARSTRHILAQEVEGALDSGEIRPWFQPQICTDTGVISGFEALARWHHPDRGVLAPGDFLDAIESAGRMDVLGHTILFHALSALQEWDKSGIRVPSVSVNFSPGELRNPALVDRVKWEVDRFDLRPGRLTIEILETVAAESEDDVVIANLSALGAHGINLDLDDFGIGQASLSAIRRFGVSRIKIDRSFVLGLDQDPEQQTMVSAILAMAQRLGVETLAEGVETAEVQALLAQLGCNHLQGFHIARPMPFADTVTWAKAHNERIACPPVIGRRTG